MESILHVDDCQNGRKTISLTCAETDTPALGFENIEPALTSDFEAELRKVWKQSLTSNQKGEHALLLDRRVHM